MCLTVSLQIFIILNLNGMQLFFFISRDRVFMTTCLCRSYESRMFISLTKNGYTNLTAHPDITDVYSSWKWVACCSTVSDVYIADWCIITQ
jgi:hypothetical protein